MTFEKGRSGNPAGRPPGSRHRVTALAEAMFEGEAEAIIRAAIDKAKEGDMTAIRVQRPRSLRESPGYSDAELQRGSPRRCAG